MSTAPIAPTAPVDGPFTRKSSGLVRDLSLTDAAWYGVFAAGSIYLFIYLFPFPQFSTPGVSMPLLVLLLLAFALPIYYVYAVLGSAMPRAGGDYLYETRTISPVVGFVAPWACELLFWLTFPASGGLVVAQFGLEPIFGVLGQTYHLHWATSVATWLTGKTGTFIVTLAVVLGCWTLTVLRLKIYRLVQRWVLVPVTIIAVICLYVIVFSAFGGNFAHKFDAYSGGITTVAIAHAAIKGGYAGVSFSLGHTLLYVAPIGGIIAYSMFSAQGMLGEVKNATNTRKLFGSFAIGGTILAIVMLALPLFLLVHVVGNRFLNQFAFAVNGGGVVTPYSANLSSFFAMLSPSPVLTILVSLGFMAAGFGISMVVFLNASRVMMAMSFDGALPALFSKVSDRTHTPITSVTIWAIACIVVVTAFDWITRWQTPLLLAGTITSLIILGFTSLAAALFPFRARDIYRVAPSPVRRTLLGVPVITIVGVIGTVLTVVLTVIALTYKPDGLVNAPARWTLLGAFVTGIIAFYGWRTWQRGRGIDPGLAFREVPPD
jgi:APA family basic amino acid/polyamine antiporter